MDRLKLSSPTLSAFLNLKEKGESQLKEAIAWDF